RAVAVLPVERRRPALALHRRPALREPQRRAAVPAVLDEGEVLAAGDEAVRQGEGLDEGAVPRPLVVEEEPLGARRPPRRAADVDDAARVLDPLDRARVRRARLGPLAVDGPERVDGEDVLDVRQHELLVLLLVL